VGKFEVPLTIDEIQRVPALLLELKLAVDTDPRPGRYLITGSVDLFRSTAAPDSPAGRIETLELLPFSQAEMACRQEPGFLTRVFAAAFPALEIIGRTTSLIDRIIAGGCPDSRSAHATMFLVRRLPAWHGTGAASTGTRFAARNLRLHRAVQAEGTHG
jgi:predicted AAA+ superfamily ATPase